jgi:Flp pilus assembly protein CpaB
MNTLGFASGSGLARRFFWDFSYKNRKKIIPLISIFIILAGIYLVYIFLSMEMRLKYLTKLEPVYVLSVSRDIKPGELISLRDLQASLVYKKEYDKLSFIETSTGLTKPSLIKIQVDEKNKSIINLEKKYSNRVANTSILKGSLLREEFLASVGTLPGLESLIPPNHSLVNIEVPKIGFNNYLQAKDRIDIYDISSGVSTLVVSNVQIVIIDSQVSPNNKNGLAPTSVDLSKDRYLTLAVPNENIARVLQVNKSKNLFISFRNQSNPITQTKAINQQYHKVLAQEGRPSQRSRFQSLTLIQGDNKQEIKG